MSAIWGVVIFLALVLISPFVLAVVLAALIARALWMVLRAALVRPGR